MAQAFCKLCFRTVLAVNELVLLHHEGVSLVIRVTAANTLDAAAREVCRAPVLQLVLGFQGTTHHGRRARVALKRSRICVRQVREICWAAAFGVNFTI